MAILDDMDEDELYQDTRALLQKLDLTKIKDMKSSNHGDSRLFGPVRQGYELRGVDITVSAKMREDPGMRVLVEVCCEGCVCV